MERFLRIMLTTVIMLSMHPAMAAQINVRVQGVPDNSKIVFQVFKSADAFGDFRDPAHEEHFTTQSSGIYQLRDLPAGNIVVLAFVDVNGNGTLDRNFIGIPKEPMGLSNNYRPKGPPSFQRASVTLEDAQTLDLGIDLYQVLGESGQWGLGVAAIGRSSAYANADSGVLKIFPAITYFGERLQWLGPQLRYGLAGSGDLRLALTASYRFGVYEEDDSPILAGLGDRDGTLLAGLSLIYEGPLGSEFGLRYEHDVLNRIGGGTAALTVSRGFQTGVVRLVPQVGINWLGEDFSNHDFGVPSSAAQPGRPAYLPGSSISTEAGVGAFFEVSENWGVAVNLSAEFLSDDITRSPIVDEDRVFKGFAALTYVF